MRHLTEISISLTYSGEEPSSWRLGIWHSWQPGGGEWTVDCRLSRLGNVLCAWDRGGSNQTPGFCDILFSQLMLVMCMHEAV